MLASLPAPLLFGLIAACMTTLGLLAVSLRDTWSLRNANLFGLAAAGMLCSMIFLHILPEAFALTQSASIWLAAGFFGGLVLNNAIQMVLPQNTRAGLPRDAITPILAIAVHSFFDGIIYAVTFAASYASGVYAALSLILHEFPEGVVAYAILRRYGVGSRQAFVYAFLAAAITTPLGVVVAGPFLHELGQVTIGSLFALSAGLLLYVATGPLLAPLKEMPAGRGLLAVLSGAVLAIAIMQIPVGGHDHSGEDLHQHDIPHTHDHASSGFEFRIDR